MTLSRSKRYLVLSVAFLGWFMAGVQMSITQLGNSAAATDLLGAENTETDKVAAKKVAAEDEKRVGAWFGWWTSGFLAGAAAGGLVFGRIGDRFGRTKALALSVLCYSCASGLAYFAQDPWQFLMLRFLAGLGVGGTWPNGVSLVSEAWSNLSRPMLAGIMGTSANIGILLLHHIATHDSWSIAPDSWRWVMLVGFSPVVLGLFTLFCVPESPRWLANQERPQTPGDVGVTFREVFRPPLLGTTLVGIGLATVPLVGAWGSINWLVRWADQTVQPSAQPDASQASSEDSAATEAATDNSPGEVDQTLKARLGQARALTGSLGSFLGGLLAHLLGRRLCYFLMSVLALGSAQYIFWTMVPSDPAFIPWVGAIGFFSGVYFGWLPLCLPELFVTRVRSTGAGVSFNFGRVLTVVTILTTATLIDIFGSNYALIGKVTSLVYAVGIIVALLVPTSAGKELRD